MSVSFNVMLDGALRLARDSSLEPQVLDNEAQPLKRIVCSLVEGPRVELYFRHAIPSRRLDDVTKECARDAMSPVIGMHAELFDLVPAPLVAEDVVAAPLIDNEGISGGCAAYLRDLDLRRSCREGVLEPLLEAAYIDWLEDVRALPNMKLLNDRAQGRQDALVPGDGSPNGDLFCI